MKFYFVVTLFVANLLFGVSQATADETLLGVDQTKIVYEHIPVLPGKPSCALWHWVPANSFGVFSIDKRSTLAPLDVVIQELSGSNEITELLRVLEGNVLHVGIPASNKGRWVLSQVKSTDGQRYRYVPYYHSIDLEKLTLKVAAGYGLSKLLETILLNSESSSSSRATTSKELITESIAAFASTLILGGNHFDGFDAVAKEFVGTSVKNNGGGALSGEVTSIVLSALSAFKAEFISYKEADYKAEWRKKTVLVQPVAGILNCTDKCSVELLRDAQGNISTDLISSLKAAKDRTLFIPRCDILSSSMCEHIKTITSETSENYFSSDWRYNISRLNAFYGGEYLAMVEDHNSQCSADSDVQSTKVRDELFEMDNPRVETLFYSGNPTVSDSRNVKIGNLIHRGSLADFSDNRMFMLGLPEETSYTKNAWAKIYPTLKAVSDREPIMLVCVYNFRKGISNVVKFWYREMPFEAKRIEDAHRRHPLLKIGPALDQCPANFIEAEPLGNKYLTWENMERGCKANRC